MLVSVREVFDLAERCFYAAGFAAGTARANAATIWWTELIKGSGVTLLHELLDDFEDLDRTRLSRRDESSVPVVEGDDQPSLVSGTPTLDLCCARANRRGLGLTYTTVDPADGTVPALGHVAHKAAERGLLSVVLYANRADAVTVVGTPDEGRPLVGEADLASPSVAYATVVEALDAGPTDHIDGLLTHAFFDGEGAERSPTAEGRLLTRLLEDATTPAGERGAVPSGFVTICLDPTHPSQPRCVERSFEGALDRMSTVFRPDATRQRADRLLHEGVEVDEAVWRDVFEYSSRVLAPEFEGSYRGAGFEINQ